MREAADNNYHTADNTPHPPLRYSMGTIQYEERKNEQLTMLQREADEMIAQLTIAGNDFANCEGQRILQKMK